MLGRDFVTNARLRGLVGVFNKSSLFLQLAGTAVLAVGLWLHFDSQTKSIFELDNDTKFYTGELGDHSGDRSHFCALISRLLRSLGLP